MKRKTTKEILADSFREIAEKKSVDKITIQEIVDNCEYSTATFYRHFKGKYDLIAWNYVHQTDEIMERVGMDGYQWKNILIDVLEYFLKNKEYIQNLLKHTSGYDSFLRQFSLANIRHLTKCILKLSNVNKLDPDMEIELSPFIGLIMQIDNWSVLVNSREAKKYYYTRRFYEQEKFCSFDYLFFLFFSDYFCFWHGKYIKKCKSW